MPNNNFDNCVSFHIDNGAFRGRLTRLDSVVNTILEKHQYPLPVSAVLAESTALAVLLASALKYEGLFTLQIQGNGPVSLVVVDVTSDGKVRGCARFDEERLKKSQHLRKTDDQIEPAPHFLGEGFLAFTVDQGPDTELYQGIVDLQGKTLSECALRYFKQSEQIDTDLKLFFHTPGSEGKDWYASGIMIQKIPEAGGKVREGEDIAESWDEAKIFMESLKADEVFDAALSAQDILTRLFHTHDLAVSETKNYRFGCRCSREKLRDTLATFKPEEIEAMCENGKISATCQFCSENYVYNRGELQKQ